jgi:3'-phosphoadenosine 5'-phosphosulfate sulfotransferase
LEWTQQRKRVKFFSANTNPQKGDRKMPLETEAQVTYAAKVENLRTTIEQLRAQMKANVETTSRQLVLRKKDLDAEIAKDADLHAAVFGSGAGSLAETITGELKAVNAMVDTVIAVTDKTRKDLEAGQ